MLCAFKLIKEPPVELGPRSTLKLRIFVVLLAVVPIIMFVAAPKALTVVTFVSNSVNVPVVDAEIVGALAAILIVGEFNVVVPEAVVPKVTVVADEAIKLEPATYKSLK